MKATIKLDWEYTDDIFSSSEERELFYNATTEEQKIFILKILNNGISTSGELDINEVDIKIEL
jgi:hypothetical protein